MKRSFKVGHTVLALGMLVLVSGCSDNPAQPTTGTATGTVTFQGTWPAAGDIQVSIYSNLAPPYVPMGPPDAFTDPIAGPVPSFDYTLDGLAQGTYSAIYVSWRDPLNPANSRLLGMFWATAGSSGINPANGLPLAAPTAITFNSTSLLQSAADITADLDLAP